MTFKEIFVLVEMGGKGIGNLETAFAPAEIIAAMNAAQQYVYMALLGYKDRYEKEDFTQDAPDEEDDLGEIEIPNLTPMIVAGTVAPEIPNYAHQALVSRALLVLNEKTGEYPGWMKNANRMAQTYQADLALARKCSAVINYKKADKVVDYRDPYRGYRTKF